MTEMLELSDKGFKAAKLLKYFLKTDLWEIMNKWKSRKCQLKYRTEKKELNGNFRTEKKSITKYKI